ncbi:MAG: M20/M25/M40 family metallo-hydrolase, partial [Bacteroidales bacterium]
AISLLKKLISTPSHSREECGASRVVAEFLADTVSECKICSLNNNIWVTAPGFEASRPTLMLNSHIDTVKPVSGWSMPPYEPVEVDDKLYGLGSNDAGASLVSLIAVFRLLCKTVQRYNIIFAASTEEEVSGACGMEALIKVLPPLTLGIVGEPTGMHPAVAEKGLMVLDCYVYGVSGHAAREEGENAIYKALPIVDKLRAYKFSRVSPELGEVKITVTQISAGTQHNVVPDLCTFVVDIRGNGLYTNFEILQELQNVIPKTECELKPRSTRLNSSGIDVLNPFVKRCTMMGLVPFGSPTLSDQALIPYPTVKIGPGNSSRSHTADEYIFKSEIREAIEIYVKLLDGLKL